jgi:hypothetical protein
MINWGSNSALAGFQNALALGADIGGAIKQNREDSALAAFMTASSGAPTAGAPVAAMGAAGGALSGVIPQTWGGNGGGIVPNEDQKSASQAAYERLASINPRLAFEVQGKMADQQAKRAKYAQEQQAAGLRQKAAQGDPAALQQLVGIDFDSWKTLDANKRRMVEDQTKFTGQAALRISQLPAEQQAAAWDQAVEQGVQAGYTGMADYRGKFSPQALQGAIDNAGLVEKFIELAQPKYQVIPENGTLVDTRNPQAVASFAGGANPVPAITPPATIQPETALRNATARGYVLPDEAAAIKANLGGNGQAAFDGWLQQNNVKVVTRTGTSNGRKVIQFSDGTTQYAD